MLLRRTLGAAAAALIVGVTASPALAAAPGRTVHLNARLLLSPVASSAKPLTTVLRTAVTVPRGDRIAKATVDFGDHTKPMRLRVAQTKVSHTFAAAGRYVVTFTLLDAHHHKAVARRTVVIAGRAGGGGSIVDPRHPVAALRFDDQTGLAQRASADSAVADASSSTAKPGTSLVSGTLDYGDGTTTPFDGDSSAWVDAHTYGKGGVYVAKLTIVESDGQQATTSVVVTVFDIPTVTLHDPLGALFSGTPISLSLDSATPAGTTWDGTVVDWGDGTDQQGYDGNPPGAITHTYKHAGVYSVTVAVADDLEGIATDSVTFVVL